MPRVFLFRLLTVFLMVLGMATIPTRAQTQAQPQPQPGQEARFALVIGQDTYAQGALRTAANDAGLVADVLRDAGFDVTGLRNVDNATLLEQAGEFIDRVSAAGPGAVALVYYSGYGIQYRGENYLVPTDARFAADTDIPNEALRLGELLQGLAEQRIKARIVLADVGYKSPFAPTGQPLAGGLALVEPPQGVLVGFNTAPGAIVAPPASGDYGEYASALAEMMREGGIGIEDVLARVRLRVNQRTNGAAIPWFSSRLTETVQLFDRAPETAAVTGTSGEKPAVDPVAEMAALKALRTKPASQLTEPEAYTAAVADDTVEGYQRYLDSNANAENAARVRAMLAARREARWWARAVAADTTRAYWTYLKRYPDGPHADEARARLADLRAAREPPPVFDEVVYDDLPPPPIEEVRIITRRRYVDFVDFGFLPPPPPPMFVLAAPFFIPPPPPVVIGFGILPIPVLPPPVAILPAVVAAPVAVGFAGDVFAARARPGFPAKGPGLIRDATHLKPMAPGGARQGLVGRRPGAPAGAQGLAGRPGPTGVAGRPGLTGRTQGLVGRQPGVAGQPVTNRQGLQGLPSRSTLPGQAGVTGRPGLPGQAGVARPGVAGLPGQAGVARPGLTGRPGLPGQAGVARPGVAGLPGQAGVARPGLTGRPGLPTAAGRPGLPGTAATRPSALTANPRLGPAGQQIGRTPQQQQRLLQQQQARTQQLQQQRLQARGPQQTQLQQQQRAAQVQRAQQQRAAQVQRAQQQRSVQMQRAQQQRAVQVQRAQQQRSAQMQRAQQQRAVQVQRAQQQRSVQMQRAQQQRAVQMQRVQQQRAVQMRSAPRPQVRAAPQAPRRACPPGRRC